MSDKQPRSPLPTSEMTPETYRCECGRQNTGREFCHACGVKAPWLRLFGDVISTSPGNSHHPLCKCGNCPAAAPPSLEAPVEMPIKGSFRVWAEIRGSLNDFGETHFSADRSMLEHWEKLLASEMDDDLKARLPEMRAQIKAIEDAAFVSRKILNERITI